MTRGTKDLIKGGMGGRISSADIDWNYFVNIKKVILYPVSPEEKVERNRSVFINFDKVQDFTVTERKEKPVQVS